MKYSVRTKSIKEALVEDLVWDARSPDPPRWVNYQPGNGTAYRFLIQRFPAGSPPARWYLSGKPGWLVTFATPNKFKPFVFGEGFLDFYWVAGEVQCGIADAIVLAEIFADIAGVTVQATSSEEFLEENP